MRFIIATYARTGASLLGKAIGSHPQVYYHHEIFHRNNVGDVYDPISYVENLYKTCPFVVTHQGFKLATGQARKPPLKNIWNYIQRKKYKVIILTRRNLFNRYLSNCLVMAHQSPARKGKPAWQGLEYTNPVTIDPIKCVADIKLHMHYDQFLKETFENNPVFALEYETIFEVYPKILEFLELPDYPPKWSLPKQRTKTQQEMITNYQELKEALKETPYIKFLDEEKL